MRYIFALILTSAIAFGSAVAQESDTSAHKRNKIQTIFGTDEFENGGFGALEMKVGSIKSGGETRTGMLLGGRGGWIINHVFSIGGGGYGLVSKADAGQFTNGLDTTLTLHMGYGGLIFEYINRSNEVFHFTVNALIGAGGATYTVKNADSKSDTQFDYNRLESSGFFVFEPSLNGTANIFTWFRISAGVSYRLISGLDLKHYVGNSSVASVKSGDLSGLSGHISFQFGQF